MDWKMIRYVAWETIKSIYETIHPGLYFFLIACGLTWSLVTYPFIVGGTIVILGLILFIADNVKTSYRRYKYQVESERVDRIIQQRKEENERKRLQRTEG